MLQKERKKEMLQKKNVTFLQRLFYILDYYINNY